MRRLTVNVFSSLLFSIIAVFCIATSSRAADDTTLSKPITPDSIPNKIKALENSDGTLKLKSRTSSKPSSKSATTPSKEELSQDELVERIAKKMAELHKENERVKVLAATRKVAAPATTANPPRAPETAMQPHNIRWSYDGEGAPGHWGKIDPANARCDAGERQSPIDIKDGIRVDLEPIEFDYKPVRFNVIDDGHSIQVNLGAGNNISILGRRYDLVQFHFHKPSEEHVNGITYAMDMHLVHKDIDGKLVVIAILIQEGKANSLVQTIWNNMPLEKNSAVQPPGTIDLNQLLPVNRQYYTYMGSLTTPPCAEEVLWAVYKEPVELSQEQISIFSRMYPMNARPIQNSAGRLIKESN